MTDIAERLEGVRDRISRAAEASGRTDEVELVAVTKTVPAAQVLAAYSAGQRLFGENRVQEAAAKIEELGTRTAEARWHLIGHLQSNKVRPAVESFSLVESVDSLRLATRLNNEADRLGKCLPILIEVNVAGESAKSGFTEAELDASVEQMHALPWLDPKGFMTVAPLTNDPESIRWVFRRLRELRDSVQQGFGLSEFHELSMGMSNDFEVAIQEGATIVRLGRAIFGERPK